MKKLILLFLFLFSIKCLSQTPDKYFGWDGWEGTYKNINCLIYSKDGKMIISGGEEQKVRFWNSTDGKSIKAYSQFNKNIDCININSSGDNIIVSGNSNDIYIWDINTDSLLNSIKNNNLITYSIFSPDDKTIAFGLYNGTIRLLRKDNYSSIKDFNIGFSSTYAKNILFSSDSKMFFIYTWGNSPMINLYDINSSFLLKTFYSNLVGIRGMALSKDGKTLVSMQDASNQLQFWDCENWSTGKLIKTISTNPKGTITCMCLSGDGSKIATGSAGGDIKIWDFKTGVLLKSILFDIGYPISICFSPDGTQIASGGYGYKNIRIYDLGIVVVKENEMYGDKYSLAQNYPNPFNPETIIKYSVPKSGIVTIKIFDILGSYIETLVNKEHRVGEYSINWRPQNLTSGVYYYELRLNNQNRMKKMIYNK